MILPPCATNKGNEMRRLSRRLPAHERDERRAGLRRSVTPDFADAEDIDKTKYKLPYADDDGEAVPGKYNIVLKLPEGATSGFYRLEW